MDGMKIISMEEYKKLLDSTIELYKINEIVVDLKEDVQTKNDIIEDLKRQNSELMNNKIDIAHLTTVSSRIQ